MVRVNRVALLLVVACAAGCPRTPAERPKIVEAGPADEVTAAELKEGLRLLFDRPAVPASLVGRTLSPSPLAFDPPLGGEARFIDRQTLVFLPSEAPRSSTQYQVTLARGPWPEGMEAPPPWAGLRFVYERLALEQLDIEGQRRFQPRRPTVVLEFNHPVAPAQAAASCHFVEQTGRRVAARPAREGSEPARVVRLTSAEDLAPASEHLVRCFAGLRGVEGDQGLALDTEDRFQTFGPLSLVGFGPQGSDTNVDGAVISVEFSNPIELAELMKHLTVKPPIKGLALSAHDDEARKFEATVNLEPDTDYTITVDKELADPFGQKLGTTATHKFHAGDASPRLRVERGIFTVEARGAHGGRYPVWTRNLGSFTVDCAAVPEGRLVALLTGEMSYDSWSYNDNKVDFAKLGLPHRQRTVRVKAPRNAWHDDGLDLASVCGGRSPAAAATAAMTGGTAAGPATTAAPSGVYVLAFEAADEVRDSWRPARTALANVTDLGLLAKVGNASSLLWVVRLSDGKPVAGATVAIRDLKGKVRFQGQTGDDGTITAPGATRLAAVRPRGARKSDDGEDWAEEWDSLRERRVIVTARLEGDLAVLDTNWNNGVQIWNFGVSDDRRGGEVRLRGFLQSDRGLYRPGDTVHLRGLVRVVEAAGRMRMATQKKLHLVVNDPRGVAIVDENLPLSGFGGFHRDVMLAADARLGDYEVLGTVGDQSFRDRFAVEEYRPRSFEVKLGGEDRTLLVGDKLKLKVSANYLYGAPLKGGKLAWRVRSREYVPSFAGFDQYSFRDWAAMGDDARWGRWDEARSFTQPVADGERTLDGKGAAALAITDDRAKAGGDAREYLVTAEITDASGQGVEQSLAMVAHRSVLYLGIHPEEFVQATEMPFAVQAVALTPEGKRRAARAELRLVRRTYDCGARGASFGASWSCDKKEAEALRREVAIPETGTAVERVVLQEPGEYAVSITGKDERGEAVTSSETIYVIGKGEAFWSGDEGDRIGVTASKPIYKIGDVARLVPRSPFSGMTALVTLERDGIVKRFVTQLASSGQGIEIPIEATYAPNVFASVALVRGRMGEAEPDKQRPRFKMGMVNLVVDTAPKRLKVAIETERPSYRPGEQVRGVVRVSDAGGAPVQAELAVAVADEGVLQIAGYRTPDPMATFYEPFGLGVETSTTWNRIKKLGDPNAIDDGGEEGDGGGDESGRVRSRFMATAYWNPAVVTGADGTGRFELIAPDNLTAFRIMAVGADAGDRFGSGELRFTVRKPLLAMPAVPRFLAVGDQARAGVVIHNHTGAGGKVKVKVTARGVKLLGAAEQEVEVAEAGERPVLFALGAERAGTATLRFRATLGAEEDAVEVKLPVERPLVREALALGEGKTDSRVEMAVRLPEGALADEGGLELVLDPTGLSRLDEGLRYLVGYPYGCLEQTTSKVVPMVALGELTKTLDLPEVDKARLKGFVETGVTKIVRHQHEEGGFSLWPGSEPEPHLTAFALWGLGLAAKAGYHVDPSVKIAGMRSLRQALSQTGRREGPGALYDDLGEGGTRAFALYVLSTLDQSIGGEATRLYEQRAGLPVYGKAWLARAMHRGGQKVEARRLVDEIAALAPAGGGPVMLHEPGAERLWWYMSSDARTTAITLGALVEVAPEHPLVERLAEGLVAAREGGRWSNTQENLYSLVALAEIGRVRAGAPGGAAARVRVLLDGGELATYTLGGGEVVRAKVAMAKVRPGALVIEASGRPVYYVARLRVARAPDVRGEAHGFAVRHEYLDAESNAPIAEARLGQVVKVRVTVEKTAYGAHVAVVDRLPAGLEPVLDRFRTRAEADEDGPVWARRRPAFAWRELRDDRVELFAEDLSDRVVTHEYLARATTPGTFVVPPSTVEAMYRPALWGRSDPGSFTVKGK